MRKLKFSTGVIKVMIFNSVSLAVIMMKGKIPNTTYKKELPFCNFTIKTLINNLR